jgi:SAM-dependent methyltransferase
MKTVYDQARLYDVAFSFRDIGAECDALTALAQRHLGRMPTSVLELAAGPARHARELARRGMRATALDLFPAMVEYARDRARDDGVSLDAVVGDMTNFSLPGRYDLALLLMDSASHLLDNDAVLHHLGAVARHLVPGGLYVLEMHHPRDAFGIGSSTDTDWTCEQDGLKVTTRWGHPGDPFDPILQQDQVSVTLDWEGPEGSGRLQETVVQRRFAANEFDALVRASGVFELVERRGSLTPDVPFDNRKAAWRMVPVLRRRADA